MFAYFVEIKYPNQGIHSKFWGNPSIVFFNRGM
jgi:hypothetical protein